MSKQNQVVPSLAANKWNRKHVTHTDRVYGTTYNYSNQAYAKRIGTGPTINY